MPKQNAYDAVNDYLKKNPTATKTDAFTELKITPALYYYYQSKNQKALEQTSTKFITDDIKHLLRSSVSDSFKVRVLKKIFL